MPTPSDGPAPFRDSLVNWLLYAIAFGGAVGILILTQGRGALIAAGGVVGAGLFVMLMIVIAARLARVMARRARR